MAFIRHVATTMPEFRHLVPEAIVVVAGEARRASRGTVKPLAFAGGKRTDGFGRQKPMVKVNGHRVLYCITLRPLFFRSSSARDRVGTLLHELFHISRKFDGTLDRARRHARMGKRFDQAIRPLVRRCWASLPAELKQALSHDGEVKVLQWLERPGAWLPGERASGRRTYTEAHLFTGIVRLKTRRPPAPATPLVH